MKKTKIALWMIGSFILVVVLSVGAYIYINPGPSMEHTEGAEWLTDIPIAHRGFHTEDLTIPENSMAAVEKAMDKGYAIEIDIHLSADGEVVVFHDAHLQRMTGVDAYVDETAWQEMKELTLLETEETIPRLDDVLERVDGEVPLLIEIKNEGSVGELEEGVLELVQDYDGDFAIQAFNPFVLQFFKEQAPDIIRGQLSGSFEGENLPFYEAFALRYLALNNFSEPHFVAYEYDWMPQWLANRQKAKNVDLLTWTIISEEEMHHALDGKYDNVIFEFFEPDKDFAG
ncbi:glycerophosphodiester phosphodiesterase family protein [Natribacillus halophilus]|uniref:Glycerophosphoryl diester phosphodiesterase n=1 Tax=Natribacillus halophilus TaxID=549003 RepID=A0A1G8J4N1_9BACI|nr:glycerophosphodiester phosphodiesterase family protein [Natribacillus halophilus]SDI26248.1 Glycerophosphoryl diester phosphodiesterase [Natribacillus halophilus]